MYSSGTRSQHEHMMQRGHDYEVVEESLTGYSSSTHRKVPAEEPKFKGSIMSRDSGLHFHGLHREKDSAGMGRQKKRDYETGLTISESCRTQSSVASSSSQLEIMAITPSVSSSSDGSAIST